MTKNKKEFTEAPVNFGANLGLMLDLYDDYLQDPSSVPEDLKQVKLISKLNLPLMGVVHKREIAQLNVLCA